MYVTFQVSKHLNCVFNVKSNKLEASYCVWRHLMVIFSSVSVLQLSKKAAVLAHLWLNWLLCPSLLSLVCAEGVTRLLRAALTAQTSNVAESRQENRGEKVKSKSWWAQLTAQAGGLKPPLEKINKYHDTLVNKAYGPPEQLNLKLNLNNTNPEDYNYNSSLFSSCSTSCFHCSFYPPDPIKSLKLIGWFSECC